MGPWVADPEDDFEYIETYNNEGTNDWYAPDENRIKITLIEITSIEELHPIQTKQEIARFNIIGQSIDFKQEGLQFIQFDDGSIQ